MNQRIIVICGSNIHHLAELVEAMALQCGAAVTVVENQTTPVQVIKDASNCTTNLSAALKEMVRYHNREDYIMDVEQVLDGIRELREWFQNKVHQVVNTFVISRRQHRFPIFQPCWSARRWKSLT